MEWIAWILLQPCTDYNGVMRYMNLCGTLKNNTQWEIYHLYGID